MNISVNKCSDVDIDSDTRFSTVEPARKRDRAIPHDAKTTSAPHKNKASKKRNITSPEESPEPPASVHQKLLVVTPALKRSQRMLDPDIPEHQELIARATKAGSEYYDSDEDLPGNAKDTNKPHLFRNVKWGTYATDLSNDAEFPAHPEL